MSERVTEVRIARARAPRCHRLARLRRWRWDVTAYRKADGEFPGVLDRRVHLGSGGMGYTFTAVGAALAAGRAVRREATKSATAAASLAAALAATEAPVGGTE